MRVTTLYLTGREPGLLVVFRKAFPDYTQTNFRLCIADGQQIDVHPKPRSGWYSEFALCDLDTLEVKRVVEVREGRRRPPLFRLPRRIVVVEHRWARHRDEGLIAHINGEDVNRTMLPQRCPDLSADELIVLHYTANYMPSYGGDPRYRKRMARKGTGITIERWDKARERLRDRGLLTRQFGIRPFGLNEVSDYWHKEEEVKP